MNQKLPEQKIQVEVVDDCSNDIDVQRLVSSIGKGRIGYYRQPYNVGVLRNLEACLNISRGHYIHILQSDDIVHPGFYLELEQLFTTYQDIGAAFCRYQDVNDDGKVTNTSDLEAPVPCVLENWLQRISSKKRIQYASIAVKREVYEKLGGFCCTAYNEDWEMWARIATQFKFAYTPRILASSRAYCGEATLQSLLNGTNLRDTESVLKKIGLYLPKEQRANVIGNARKYSAYNSIQLVKQVWGQYKNPKGLIAQLRGAWGLHKDPLIALQIARVAMRIILNR